MQSLKTTGTLDSLKTQVRAHLLQELKRQGALGAAAGAGRGNRPAANSLQQRALDSLVLAHLRASSYEYSASVLAPEAGLTDGPLDYPDICKALDLPVPRDATAAAASSPLAAVFSTVIYHHMPRERRCLRHSGAQR